MCSAFVTIGMLSVQRSSKDNPATFSGSRVWVQSLDAGSGFKSLGFKNGGNSLGSRQDHQMIWQLILLTGDRQFGFQVCTASLNAGKETL